MRRIAISLRWIKMAVFDENIPTQQKDRHESSVKQVEKNPYEDIEHNSTILEGDKKTNKYLHIILRK